MKRHLLLIALLLLLPSPVRAQTSLLPDLQRERAKHGPSMTSAEVAQMLNVVAWAHRTEGWGLLRKGSGNSCPLAGTFVSCDILIYSRGATEHFDVLIDAEGRAEPTWQSDGPCVPGPSSGCDMARFFAPVDPGNGPPDPPPAGTLQAQIDALVAQLAALRAQVANHETRIGTGEANDARIDHYLATRPIAVGCSSLLRCALVFPPAEGK